MRYINRIDAILVDKDSTDLKHKHGTPARYK